MKPGTCPQAGYTDLVKSVDKKIPFVKKEIKFNVYQKKPQMRKRIID